VSHRMTIGHLDAAALRRGRAVVLRPLDPEVVHRLLEKHATKGPDGTFRFRHAPVCLTNGCVCCTWLVPSITDEVEAFARDLIAETGCIAADVSHREVIDLGR
jgi:hypothetical protein